MDRVMRRNRFERFRDDLRVNGYKSYDDYLRSPEWQAFKDWYFSTHLPKKCIVCQSEEVILHHWNYDRVGCEMPCDVVPLCDNHHEELHRWMKSNGNNVRHIREHLVGCFGFSKDESYRAMRPFFKMHKRSRATKKSVPHWLEKSTSVAKEGVAEKRVCRKCGRSRDLDAFDRDGRTCDTCRNVMRPMQVQNASELRPKRNAKPKRCKTCGKRKMSFAIPGECADCFRRGQFVMQYLQERIQSRRSASERR